MLRNVAENIFDPNWKTSAGITSAMALLSLISKLECGGMTTTMLYILTGASGALTANQYFANHPVYQQLRSQAMALFSDTPMPRAAMPAAVEEKKEDLTPAPAPGM